jgi:hypothetical protein
VTRYLVELYLPRGSAGGLEQAAARAGAEAGRLSEEGVEVRCLRSIFVPADETWFLLYDAPCAAAVQMALDRAGLGPARVAEAVAP